MPRPLSFHIGPYFDVEVCINHKPLICRCVHQWCTVCQQHWCGFRLCFDRWHCPWHVRLVHQNRACHCNHPSCVDRVGKAVSSGRATSIRFVHPSAHDQHDERYRRRCVDDVGRCPGSRFGKQAHDGPWRHRRGIFGISQCTTFRNHSEGGQWPARSVDSNTVTCPQGKILGPILQGPPFFAMGGWGHAPRGSSAHAPLPGVICTRTEPYDTRTPVWDKGTWGLEVGLGDCPLSFRGWDKGWLGLRQGNLGFGV